MLTAKQSGNPRSTHQTNEAWLVMSDICTNSNSNVFEKLKIDQNLLLFLVQAAAQNQTIDLDSQGDAFVDDSQSQGNAEGNSQTQGVLHSLSNTLMPHISFKRSMSMELHLPGLKPWHLNAAQLNS